MVGRIWANQAPEVRGIRDWLPGPGSGPAPAGCKGAPRARLPRYARIERFLGARRWRCGGACAGERAGGENGCARAGGKISSYLPPFAPFPGYKSSPALLFFAQSPFSSSRCCLPFLSPFYFPKISSVIHAGLNPLAIHGLQLFGAEESVWQSK